jgi:hypothetical protein
MGIASAWPKAGVDRRRKKRLPPLRHRPQNERHLVQPQELWLALRHAAPPDLLGRIRTLRPARFAQLKAVSTNRRRWFSVCGASESALSWRNVSIFPEVTSTKHKSASPGDRKCFPSVATFRS